MVDFLTLPIAIILGFLAGLGVGGGSLLIVWLTTIVGMEYPQARVINLIFFLPTALIASLFHQKQETLKIKKILPAIAIGCVCAALFSFIGNNINTEALQKCFGGLLLLTGLRELFYRPRKAK